MTESVGMCAHEREWERAKQSTHTQNATQAHTPKTQNLTVLALNLYWICNSPFFFLSISTPFSDRVRWTLHFPIILGKLFSLALHDSSLDLIYQYFFLGSIKNKIHLFMLLDIWVFCGFVRLWMSEIGIGRRCEENEHAAEATCECSWPRWGSQEANCGSYHMRCRIVLPHVVYVFFFLFSFLISIILVIYVFVFYLFIYWFYMFLSSIIVTCLCLFSENLDWFVVLIVIGYLGSCCF